MNFENVASNNAISAGSHIDPLLAKLYHTRTSFESVDGATNLMRARMCADMSVLLGTSSRGVEREMVADILLSLLKRADMELKRALSERLSTIPNVPLRLILNLVGESIEIADPVLRYSDALNDLDLLYIIQSRDAPYWRAIAARQNLGENVVDALIDTKDDRTAGILVDNATAKFSAYAASAIEKLAQADHVIAAKLLARGDIPNDIAHKIYSYVSEDIRASLRHKFGKLAPDVQSHIDDVMSEFVQMDRPSLVPTVAMLRASEMFMQQGKLTTTLMLRTLKRGQVASFMAQFSVYCGLPHAVIMPMFDQRDRHGLAVACRASGFTRNEFSLVLMLTRDLPGKTELSSADMQAALDYFDRMSEKAAQRIMRRGRH